MSIKNEKYRAIGLMSGTSLDGLDICLASFSFDKTSKTWSYTIEKAQTVSYPKALENNLRNCIDFGSEQLNQLDLDLGDYFGEQVNVFLEGMSRENIDFIASHGHTVFHKPEEKYTLQIGAGERIKAKTGLTVIYDFRSEDVRLGGQGAPLVPVGDKLLFHDQRFCLNLGGIANISFDDSDGVRRAFDVCGCNLILNHLAQRVGLSYDKNGEMAASGTIQTDLLIALNSNPYYQKKGPRSLGKEHLWNFDLPVIERYMDAHPISIADSIATYTQHIASKIHSTLIDHSVENESMVSLLITGGGAHNTTLIELLKEENSEQTPSIAITPCTDSLLDYKEALVFAFLGVLKMRNEINIFSSVTGASKDSISGLIC